MSAADGVRIAVRMVPHLLWVMLMWLVFTALAETGHLIMNRATYWSWLIQAIFYSLLFVGYLSRPLRDWTLLIGLHLIHGTVWAVAVLITLIIARDDGLLLRATTLAGGSVRMGVAVGVHAVVHYVPVPVVWLAVGAYWDVARARYRAAATRLPVWAYVLWAVATVLSPAVLIGIWDAIFDPHRIYRTTFTGAQLWLIGAPTVLIFNGVLFFLLVVPYDRHVRGGPLKQAGAAVATGVRQAVDRVAAFRFY